MLNVHSNYVMLAYGITGAGKTYTLEEIGNIISHVPYSYLIFLHGGKTACLACRNELAEFHLTVLVCA